ncbi:hypothetical protein, partial [uncultured Bacteroides sp.]|uniref:hypothetical protein n=1 Tax=uncultured Bacteroides sp. TaxID=162156 RepID=UPI00259964D8
RVCTTADRIARIKESAKHQVSDSLSGLLRRLRSTGSCYFSHSVFLRRLHFSLLEPLRHSPLVSSPRAETVMCRLPALSAYHRLAFPGQVSAIINLKSTICVLSTNDLRLMPGA